MPAKGLLPEAAVQVLVEEGPARIQELIRWGALFDRPGEYRPLRPRENPAGRGRQDQTSQNPVRIRDRLHGASAGQPTLRVLKWNEDVVDQWHQQRRRHEARNGAQRRTGQTDRDGPGVRPREVQQAKQRPRVGRGLDGDRFGDLFRKMGNCHLSRSLNAFKLLAQRQRGWSFARAVEPVRQPPVVREQLEQAQTELITARHAATLPQLPCFNVQLCIDRDQPRPRENQQLHLKLTRAA